MCQLLVMGNEDTLAGFPARQVRRFSVEHGDVTSAKMLNFELGHALTTFKRNNV
jgi:hypothetical protein